MLRNTNRYTDQELLRKYAEEDDLQYLGAALERYTRLLLGVALKYVQDIHTAQDLVQQVFLKALEKLPKKELNFGGWLYTVMRNECFDYLKKKETTTYAELKDLSDGADGESEAQHKHWERALKEERLLATLQDLKEDQRRALDFFYLQNKSYQEIAEICGWSLGDVKTHIQNGKRNLKIKFEKNSDREQA